MHEQMKKLCPIELVKNLGAETVWLFQKAMELRNIEIVNLDRSFEEEWEVQ